MRKPTEHILERELVSKAYSWILAWKDKKEPLIGYQLAKLVYGKGFYHPVKIYLILKELEKSNLIKVEETIIKNKKAKIIKPNLLEFVKVLNERRLPENSRLTNEEVEVLAKFLENEISLGKGLGLTSSEVKPVIVSVGEIINILDGISLFLKIGSIYSEEFRKRKKDFKKFEKMLRKTKPEYATYLEIYEPFFKLPRKILTKLRNLRIPRITVSLTNLLEILFLFIPEFSGKLK